VKAKNHRSGDHRLQGPPNQRAIVEPPAGITPVRPQLTDTELIRQIRGGETQAFAELMGRYAMAVTAYISGDIRIPADREDIVQEVFILAYRRLHTLRDPARFGPWLIRIARNRATDYHRARRREMRLQEAAADIAKGATGTRHNAEPIAPQVEAAISRLRPAYRPVLRMRLFAGMAPVEIAKVLGTKESTVRMRLKRGLEKLRHELEAQGITRLEIECSE
jgi:RNA polymerase sigma-70 factor, ECF subfamily